MNAGDRVGTRKCQAQEDSSSRMDHPRGRGGRGS
jgi:hypothetical protein